MIINKDNLTEEETRMAMQCENALAQLEPTVVASLAVLDHDQIYGLIKDKITPEQKETIDDVVVNCKILQEALPE